MTGSISSKKEFISKIRFGIQEIDENKSFDNRVFGILEIFVRNHKKHVKIIK